MFSTSSLPVFSQAEASVSEHDPVSHLHANLQEKDRVKMELGVREEGPTNSPNDLPVKMGLPNMEVHRTQLYKSGP